MDCDKKIAGLLYAVPVSAVCSAFAVVETEEIFAHITLQTVRF